MPTFKQVEAAFLNAHNAGDSAAAQKLADALRNQMSAPDAPASGLPKRGLGGTLSGGFNRGMSRLGSTFTDVIPAIAGSAIGADEYAQEQLAEAEEKQRKSAMLDPPQFQTFKEVDGLRSGLGFAAETMAEQVGNMGVALATGLTGGAAAPALLGGRALAAAATTGAARNLAAKTVAQQAAIGTAAGAYLGSYALNAPEVFENIYRETGETAPGTALLFGTLSAGLDAVLPAALATKMTGPLKLGVVQNLLARSGMQRGVLRSGAAGLATGLGIEGVTEGAQEGISIAAERFIDENPEVFGSKEWDRIIESGVRGAVAGGGFGTAGGGIEGAREGAQRKQRLDNLEEARALRNQIRSKYEVPAEQQPEGMTTTSGAQQGFSFVDPVNLSQSPEEVEESLQAAREEAAAVVEVEPTDFKVPVTVSSIYALETAKRRGEIPTEVKLKKLDETQTKIVENIQQEESQRVLYADATVEAQRRGVEFDANKAPNELSEEEQILLGEVAESRVGRYGKSQQSLFTMDGAPVKQTSKQKRAEKAAIAESFKNLKVIPTDKAGLQAWGKANFGLGPSTAILRENGPLAGKDLSNPVEAAQVEADLKIVRGNSTSKTVPERIDEFFARLESQAKPAVKQSIVPSSASINSVPDPQGVVVASEASAEELANADIPQLLKASNEYNDKVSEEVITTMLGPEKAAEYAKLPSGSEQQLNWFAENSTDVFDLDVQVDNRWINTDRLESFKNYVGVYSEASPKEMGKSISKLFQKASNPDFKSTPEYAGILSAVNYAKEQGWNVEEVIAGAKIGAKEYAGTDFQELFPELFSVSTSNLKPNKPTEAATRIKIGKKSPAALQTLSDIDKKYTRAPLNNDQFVGDGAAVEVSAIKDRLHLSAIVSLEKGTGKASKLLTEIIQIADKNNTPIELAPVPFGSKDLNTEQLTNWYARYGFVQDGAGTMVRPPKAKAKAAGAATRREGGEGLNGETVFSTTDANAFGMTTDMLDYQQAPILDREPNYFRDNKDIEIELVNMSPDEYLQKASKILSENEGSKRTPQEIIEYKKTDERPDYIPLMAQSMREGNVYAAPELDYKDSGQEGMHRALAAKQLGITSIPVMVKDSYKNPQQIVAKGKAKGKAKPKAKSKPKLAGPIYKGKNLNTETIEAVGKGRLAPVLSQLINTATNREVKRVLKKIKSLGLTSKLVIAPVQGAAGTYDPNTNIITLDPVTGFNEHTLIHELIHAALQKVIATPNLQITKDLTDFYASIYSRLGDTYGTKNLQEFVAEFIANPEFQALLKTIDAPRGGNWVTRIAKTIAEFFGFRKKQSAYKAGLKFISDAIDISSGVEAVPGEVLLLGPGTNLGSMVEFGTNSKAELSQAVNNFKGDTAKKAMFAFVSLRNMIKLYGDKVVDAASRELLPILQTNVESKRGAISLGVEKASEGIRKVKELEQNATPAQIAERNSIAFDASKAGVDIREPATRDPAFKVTADNKAEFDALRVRYNRLPNELRESYNIIRADLDANFNKWLEEISNSDIPRSTQQKIKDEFTSMGVVGYVPRTRPGKYALEFDGGTTNKKEERVVTSFRDVTERDAAFDILEDQKKKPQRYSFVPSKAPSAQGLPTASFIRGVVSEMRAAGVDEKVIDNVYQYYIDQQGASALTKQLTVKSQMLEGFDTDLTRAYADQMYKWVHMLTNLKYNPKISETFRDIAKTIKANGTITTNRNLSANQRENLEAALSSLAMQETFMLNPNFNGVTSFLTYSSYIGFIAGSVSSAVVNLTGLIFMVYPSLASRFGYDNALREMKDASQVTFVTKDWSKGKYAELYTYLDNRSLLRQTTDMEIIDRAKGEAKGALSSFDKVIKFASIPFAASEKMQRAITAVAAFELAIKSKDSNYNTPEKAMEYAANQIRDAHSAGISDVAPRAFQHNIGRVILTFKQIVFTQAATLAFTFARALPNSGLSAEEKSIARHQFLATFGISGALLGVGGLPFFGLYTTLARMLEFMIPDDEDAPYDPKQQLRDVTNSFIYNGLIAELFNIEISERAQLANNIVWRDDSYSVAKYGYLNTFLLSLFGPMGSAAQSTQGGLQEIAKGNWGRGVEDMSPLALRNLLKGIRYAREGATTRGGDIVEEDIGLLSSLIQMTGFTPASLADTQMQRSAAKNYEVEVLTRKQEIFDNYETGYNTRDNGRMREAEKDARNFIRQYPDLMDSESLKRSLRDRKARDEKKIRGQTYSQGLINTLDDIYAIRS